jgi:hypothetical protein
MLYRLMYASRAIQPSKSGAMSALMKDIVAKAQPRNTAQGVTGVLCIAGECFVQVLEGGRQAVNDTYTSIARDDRHTDITLLAYEPIAERRFAHWSMAELDLERINPTVVLKVAPSTALDPYRIEPQQLLGLLQDLLASVAVVNR